MTSVDLLARSRSEHIKKTAEKYGFLDCKISVATELTQEAVHLEKWLAKNGHGKMAYMENHFDKRIDPRKLLPGAKSVIVLSKNYYTEKNQAETAPKLSKYAYGRDYHKVIRKQLKSLLNELRGDFGNFDGRGFVDSAPILEKAWAQRSGLGWMGKHTNILTKQKGSFFFLAVLVTDLNIEPDGPVTDHCGSCTACIDACPTDAITEPYAVDGSKCISYFTIELKDAELPGAFQGKFKNWMFGCDICQDVCPWNRFSQAHSEPEFEPKPAMLDMDYAEWANLSENKFNELFHGSAVKRTGYNGLLRNINFLPKISESGADEG